MTAAAKITYRKTGKGEWVAFGPAAIVRAGAVIEVTKKDGSTKTEAVEKTGKPFDVSGVQMVYGYLAKSAPQAIRPQRSSARMCDECGTRRATTTARDLSGILGDVCSRCKRDEGSLSFC